MLPFGDRRGECRFERARRRVASSLCAAAGISALSLSAIFSSWSIFDGTAILLAAAAVFAAAVIAVGFPRLIGFPFLVALGSAIILFAWAYLVYPSADGGAVLGRLRSASNGSVLVRFGPGASDPALETRGDPLEVSVLLVSFDSRIPVVGGKARSSMAGLRTDSASGERPLRRSLLEIVGGLKGPVTLTLPGVKASLSAYPVPPSLASSGARISVVWEGERAAFRRE